MADTIDDANHQAELALQLQLRQRRETGPAATGRCLFCTTPLSQGMRWCDAQCRDAFERLQRNGRRNGQ